MNLFSEDNDNFLRKENFQQDWIDLLTNFLNIDEIEKLVNKIDELRKIGIIYPEKEDVFKLFRLLPFKDIKIVIIGQDPYFNGNADGIAFSCKNSISPSLLQIHNAINLRKGLPLYVNSGYSLEYLVKQGVFIYNPILTVDKDKPLSHKGIGWEIFTQAVFNCLKTKKDLIWLVWGKQAQESVKGNTGKYHTILTNEHPAAASRQNREWKCNDFYLTNKLLIEINKEPIKWL